MDGGGGGGRAQGVRFDFSSDRATKNIQAGAPLFSFLYGYTHLKWAVLPRLFSGLEQGAQLLRHLRGGGDRGVAKTKTTTREQQQTANQRSNFMPEDAALQPINRCEPVNRSPSDRERVQWPDQIRSGPPRQTRRFPSFPVVSRRFTSHLIVSLAFRLGSASIAGTSPAQSGKAGPIQANWPQRREGRQECGAPDATFIMFSSQVRTT